MHRYLCLLVSVLSLALLALGCQPAFRQPVDEVAELGTPTVKPLKVESWLINKPDEIVAVMSNGLRVAIKENHSNKVVAVHLYVAAGSIYEGSHLGAGLSHVFEHLLHGAATANRSEEESQLLLEEIGEHAMIASDLIDAIPPAIKKITNPAKGSG